jgi:hypothetical protein
MPGSGRPETLAAILATVSLCSKTTTAMPLDFTDQEHLTAAEGYIELGMCAEADAELEKIDPALRNLPEILDVRLRIYQYLKKWDLMQFVASTLTELDPNHLQWIVSWAFAARRAISIEAAKAILVVALERHPGAAVLHFNLACYECQNGDLDAARERLHHAITLDDAYRVIAWDDEDLAPIRHTVEQMAA